MSQFVDVTLIILDVNRTPLKGVKVKTNYQGGRAYSERTSDSTGMVTLPVSPNRVFEIHVINPEGQYEFNVALNSNKASIKPQKIVVSRTIDEYQKSTSPKSGLISFHVVMHDANNKKVKNFPCKTRYVGGSRFGEKYTNTEGTFSVPAKPNRLVEIYILQPDDSFVLQSTVNSGAGDNVVNIKLNHPIYTYMTTTELHIKDIDGSDFYPNAKLYLKYLNSEALIEGEKTKTGKLVLKGIIGEPMVLTLLKPDNKKMKHVTYISKRIKNKILTLKMPVNLVHGKTAEGEPEVDTAVTGLCACNRDITESEFKVITKSSTALSFLSDLNDQFKKLKMNNCLEKAHFIAHTLHETASYSLLEEGLPKGVQEKDVYDGYKGRGLMQITYKTNYEGYGAAVGENFTGNNKFRIAKERKHAVGSAIWYWHHSKAGNLSTDPRQYRGQQIPLNS